MNGRFGWSVCRSAAAERGTERVSVLVYDDDECERVCAMMLLTIGFAASRLLECVLLLYMEVKWVCKEGKIIGREVADWRRLVGSTCDVSDWIESGQEEDKQKKNKKIKRQETVVVTNRNNTALQWMQMYKII